MSGAIEPNSALASPILTFNSALALAMLPVVVSSAVSVSSLAFRPTRAGVTDVSPSTNFLAAFNLPSLSACALRAARSSLEP